MYKWMMSLLLVMLLALPATAQDDGSTLVSPLDLLPSSASLEGLTYHAQMWNNCGPATLTMGLSFFGNTDDQTVAANWLKPDPEDKNVSPWQIETYVNTQLPGTTRALVRHGGELDLLKKLIVNEFPVIIEAGYDPPPHDLGWMGHYLLVKGYDDMTQTFVTYDSYDGQDYPYSYDHVTEYWRHFNNLYIVLYDITREAELMALLGTDADPMTNLENTLEEARAQVITDQTDPFGWFNVGTVYVEMGNYEFAAAAYDNAFANGLPWRMLWYQFGPFEAYHNVGRYGDVILHAQNNLNDGGGQYVEETFYYAGLAREAMGEIDRALTNYNSALAFNPNFTPAREARDTLLGSRG